MNEQKRTDATDRRANMVGVWMAIGIAVGVGIGLIFGIAFNQIAGR